jgi:hypothetical protein
MRQSFEASDSIHADDGLTRRQRSARRGTESGGAMDALEFAKFFRAFFQP